MQRRWTIGKEIRAGHEDREAVHLKIISMRVFVSASEVATIGIVLTQQGVVGRKEVVVGEKVGVARKTAGEIGVVVEAAHKVKKIAMTMRATSTIVKTNTTMKRMNMIPKETISVQKSTSLAKHLARAPQSEIEKRALQAAPKAEEKGNEVQMMRLKAIVMNMMRNMIAMMTKSTARKVEGDAEVVKAVVVEDKVTKILGKMMIRKV